MVFNFFIFVIDSFLQSKSYSEELQYMKRNDREHLDEARVEDLGLLS